MGSTVEGEEIEDK